MRVKKDSGLFIGDVDVAPASGTVNITENGLHNVAPYEFADVDVPQPSGKINITENGTDIDVSNYATADVAVETYEHYLDEFTAYLEGTDTVLDFPHTVTKLRVNAFSGDEHIRQVILNEECAELGNNAFYNSTLQNINLDNVEVIGYNCFRGTGGNLQSYGTLENLKSVDQYGLYNFERITSDIELPNIETIGNSAFAYTPTTRVLIGENCTSIGSQAFANCGALTDVVLLSKNVVLGLNCFNGCPITDVYFSGTQVEFESLTGLSDSKLTNNTPTIHYNYTVV